jgi:hypothetical protein
MKDDKLIGEENDILEKQEQLNEELFILETQLDTYTSFIKYCSLISMISFSFFLICLTIKLNSDSSLNWLYVFISILITAISSSIFLNCYLVITSLIEKFDNGFTSKGTLISFFCLNSAFLILLIYFILLSLRITGSSDKSFTIISIPLFMLIGIAIFYFIFIVPAFFKNELYLEIILITNYILNSIILLLLLDLKLDNNYEFLYSYAFSPIYFSLFLHIVYTMIYLFKGERFKTILSILTLISVLCGFLLLGLMLDKFITINYLVIGLLFMTGYHIYAIEKIYNTLIQSEPKENTVV